MKIKMIRKAYKELAKKKKPLRKMYIKTDEGVGVYRTRNWLTTNGKDNLKEKLKSD